MSILIIKSSIDPIMFGEIPEKENAKDLRVVIKHQFEESIKGRQYSRVHRNFQINFKFWSCFRFKRDLLYVIFEAYFDLCFKIISFGYDVIFKSSGCGVNLNESDFIIHLHGDSIDSALLIDDLFKLTLGASYE